MNNDYSIICKDIHHSFSTGETTNHVLKGISLEIEAGKLTIIVGPSGSGKSTLLAILSGLLQPSAGKVFVLGTDLWSLSRGKIDRFRLDNCSFIFQGFNLFSALTAKEQVILPLQYAGVKDKRAQQQAIETLKNVGLGHRLDARPLTLSGGEKQRVAIARAMAKDPKLIFADEPTSALDSRNGQIVIKLLHEAAITFGATVLCVTHDPRLLGHADRIIGIEDGSITEAYSQKKEQV